MAMLLALCGKCVRLCGCVFCLLVLCARARAAASGTVCDACGFTCCGACVCVCVCVWWCVVVCVRQLMLLCVYVIACVRVMLLNFCNTKLNYSE